MPKKRHYLVCLPPLFQFQHMEILFALCVSPFSLSSLC